MEASSATDRAGRTSKGSKPAAAISIALCCGSASNTMTLPELSSIAAAKLSATVVLPTPPFWLATGMHQGRGADISVMPRCYRVRRSGLCNWLLNGVSAPDAAQGRGGQGA